MSMHSWQMGEEKTHQNSKRKWFEEKQKRLKEELDRRGLTEKDKHRLETAEVGTIFGSVSMPYVSTK